MAGILRSTLRCKKRLAANGRQALLFQRQRYSVVVPAKCSSAASASARVACTVPSAWWGGAYSVYTFSAAASAKSLDFAVSVRQDDESRASLVIESDAARVRQILANLISNAVKYTQPMGQISVAARVVLTGETPRRGRWVAVTVTDNGPGIPWEKQALVFREFARFDPGAAAGSGIRLAISRGLARALGGDITFTSTPGVGSTFTLWLPLDPPEIPAESRPAAPRVP